MGIEIIAAVLASAGLEGAVAIGGTEVALSTITAYAIVGGALVGGTLLAQSLAEKKKGTDEQQTVKQSLPPRQRGYGRALVGGSYYFFAATGYGGLLSGFILCEGPIWGAVEHWFNENICPDGGSNGADAQYGHSDIWPWRQQVDFQFQRGIRNQAPNYLLQSSPYGWSGKCNGLANTVMRCQLPGDAKNNFSKFFPSGVPNYRAVLKLSLVYDPRDPKQKWTDDSTWQWSENPALCILDFLTNARAMNIAPARIDVASFVAMANLCAQAVALAAGGVESRYIVWGMYSLDEEPKAVLERLLKTCDGELYMTAAGTIALRGGAWSEPTVTITADMVLGVEARRGRDKLSKYNQLKIRYLSLANQYQTIEGDPWDDIEAQTASGEILPEDFDGSYVPSYSQCLRLAKIQMAKDNPDWLFTVTTSLAGLNALGERIVTFDFPDLGVHRSCFVNSFEIGEDGASCKIALGTLDADAYEWSIAEEKASATPFTPAPTGPQVLPAPTNLVLSLNTVTTGGGNVSSLVATVDTPANATLGIVAQYRLQGAAAWSDMTVDDASFSAMSPPVSDGSTYEVQIAFEAYGGTQGPFTSGTIQVVSDQQSPGAPTGFSSSANVDGTSTLSWTNPNAANYFATKLYRGATSDLGSASVIATVYGSPGGGGSRTVTPQSGRNFYWAKAVNRSGVGTAAGPIEIDAA